MEHSVRRARLVVGKGQHRACLQLGGAVQHWAFRASGSAGTGQPVAANGICGIQPAEGNWATSVIWGRVHKIATDTTLNGYLLESTLNFRRRNYVFSRLELVDKDELFPQAAVHPAYRIGAYTFGGVRDLIQSRAWQLGLGADVTFYSKPAALDSSYGNDPVSFQIFLRMRPGRSNQKHAH